MSASELIIASLLFVSALLGSVVGVLAFGVALHAANRLRHLLIPMILWLSAILGCVSVLGSGRQLNDLADINVVPGDRWPNRILLAMLLGLALVALASRLFKQGETAGSRSPGLFFGMLFYYFSLSLVPSIFGYKPDMVLSQFYSLLVILALFSSPSDTRPDLENAAKSALLMVLLASAGVALFNPGIAMQTHYTVGIIPGFQLRLWGAASHANVLAPMILTFMLIEWHKPYQNRWLHIGVQTLALGLVVLTQSKTTWVAGIVAAVIIGLYRFWTGYGRRISAAELGLSRVRGVALTWVALTLLVIGAMAMPASERPASGMANSKAQADLESGTGRNIIWPVAIDQARQHPLFGYGPKLWGAEFRSLTGLGSAFHAHNQFLQVLSVAGVFGATGLLVYLGILFKYAIRHARYTGGVSLALLSVLLIRCMSEVPLSVDSVVSGDFLAHLAFLCLLMGGARQANAQVAAESASPIGNLTASDNASFARAPHVLINRTELK